MPATTSVLAAAAAFCTSPMLAALVRVVPPLLTLVIWVLPALMPLLLMVTGPALTLSKVTSLAVAILIPPLPSSLNTMLSPVTKFAVLSVLFRVLTAVPSIWVTTSCNAVSALAKLSLLACDKSTA